jgi:hypothetical protein
VNFLGYDPGGTGCNGVAAIWTEGGQPVGASTALLPNAEACIEWLIGQANHTLPDGLGIDTLTVLCTGVSGWRPADDALRNAYGPVRLSVASPNSPYGTMGLNGLTVARVLRQQWPHLVISETHPKVLYFALVRNAWAYGQALAAMNSALLGWLGLESRQVVGGLDSEHEWDALVSAFAVMQGVVHNWQVDLHRLPVDPTRHGRYVELCGFTNLSLPFSRSRYLGDRLRPLR